MGKEIANGFSELNDPEDQKKRFEKQVKLKNSGDDEAMLFDGDYIEALETSLGKVAEKELIPLQPGDVPDTFADVTDLVEDFSYKPNTPVKTGVKKFVDWYKEFHQQV